MAARPTWQGHLRLSLVSCPVALYTATSRTGDVSFNMLHKTTHNRIRMIPTDPETGPVERSDIVKGYEIEKDHYVVVTPEEIDSVRLESTKTIDIDKFVDAEEIAAKIIEQQEGDFDASEFKDRYEEALRALIKEKEKGAARKVTVDEPKGAEVIDLMEALRRSLAGDKMGAAKTSKAPAEKAAKSAPAKKRA